ncbi:MAG: hypothetical protein GY853_16800 [PVC group bacterium]|nr:hypothetical protein [PVC group bacterium]
MIEITINNKKASIPAFNELTIGQYKALVPFIAESGAVDILRYISITTGVSYSKALHFELKNVGRLNTMLGDFKFVGGRDKGINKVDYIEATKPHLIFKFNRLIYDLRKVPLAAIGYRIVLEQFMNTKPNYIDLYVFMCAAILNRKEAQFFDTGFDYDSINEIAKDLQDYNAFKVLSIGAFFFYKWKRSAIKEPWLSRIREKAILISTPLRSRKLVLIDSRNMPQLTK